MRRGSAPRVSSGLQQLEIDDRTLYDGSGTGSLSFQRGDIIEVLTKLESGWWDGVRLSNDERGWFPSNYVAQISESEAQMAREQLEADELQRQQDAVALQRFQSVSSTRSQPLQTSGMQRSESQLESELWDSINSLGASHAAPSLGDMTATDMFAEMAANAAEVNTDDERSSREGSIDGDAQSIPRTASSSRGAGTASDYWVPRVTETGQIFYVNSITGAVSRDMPADMFGESHSDSDRDQPTATMRNGVAHQPALSSGSSTDFIDPNATIRRNGGVPAAGPSDPARFSTYSSDADSALDGAPHGLPRGPRTTFENTSVTKRSLRSDLSPAFKQLQTAPLETLGVLEARLVDAFNALIDEANPRNEKDQVVEPSVTEMDRQRLFAVAQKAAAEVRTLFQETDTTFEPSLTSSSNAHGQPRWPFSIPPEATSSSFQALLATRRPSVATASTASMNQAELRPYTRKISSVMSKMLLSVRAVWGLMSVSAVEEAAKERAFGESESDEELEAYRHDRAEILKYRRTIENRLRWDIVDGARAVIEGVGQFLDELERLANDAGLSGDRTRLMVARSQQGSLTVNPVDLFTPAAASAGNWRGNGFDQSATSDLTKTFSREALALLNATRKQLGEESSELRAVLNTAIAKAAKRASAVSTASGQSGRSILSRPTTPMTGSTPAQSAARHYSKIASHFNPVVQALSAYLGSLDDIDIASRVDIDVGELIGKGKAPAKEDSSARAATALLSSFESAKQSLYDVSSSLVLDFQSIATSTLADTLPAAVLQVYPDPCEPRSAGPLSQYVVPRKPLDPVNLLLNTLVTMDRSLATLTETLDALMVIADQQAQEGHRPKPNLQLRGNASISSGNTAQGPMSSRSAGSATTNGQLQTPDSLFFPAIGRPGTGSTSNSVGRDSFASPVNSSATWDHPHYRDSYPESVASSRQTALESVSMQQTSSELSSTGSGSPTSKSPSRSKKLEKFFGVGPPPIETLRSPTTPQSEAPNFLRADYDYRDLSYNMEGQIKGGTLKALVARLTSHESVDHTYLTNFLMTFRTFCSADRLLDLLIARYFIESPPGLNAEDLQLWMNRKQKIIQIRTVNIIKIWVEVHLWIDDAEVVLPRVDAFASRIGGAPAAQLHKVVDARRRTGVPKRLTGSAAATTSPPSSIVPKKQKLLDMDALEVARQLSLMDSRLCSRITPAECLSKAWPKAIPTETPHITAMINNGNAIIHWVIDTILVQTDVRKRAATIKHFIHIAELQNFSTLMSIIAGLQSTPVHRLRRTWDTLNARTHAGLQTLTELMSANRNFSAYREAIRSVGPPCVPFIGVFLTSWTFIGDGNSDFLREKQDQINMQKRSKAAELISQIQLYQLTPYNLHDVPIIRTWIEDQLKIAIAKDEQTFYAMSLQLEPRERDDEKIARLLAESGFL